MRIKLLILLCYVSIVPLFGQVSDEVFKVVDEMPRFPGCEEIKLTTEDKIECANKSLLQFIYNNINYPDSARLEGIEGTVVVRFIVEKDGSISSSEVLRDIGANCGSEALRVVNLMSLNDLKWIPGKQNGKVVRVEQNLPIKFKLEAPKDYIIINRERVWTVFDKPAKFDGDSTALEAYLKNNIKYPQEYQDSCRIGDMDVTLVVKPDGSNKVLDVANYSNLDFEFVVEAIHTAHQSWYKWIPAEHEGKKVPTSYSFRVHFEPEGSSTCLAEIQNFHKAEAIADDAVLLLNEEKSELGLAKINAALALDSTNVQYYYIRSQANMQLKKLEEACEDLTRVNAAINNVEVKSLQLIVCGKVQGN